MVSDSAGVVYSVERYAGARGGLNIVTPDGPASNAETLLQRLTGNATPDLFRNVFAFSLDELQTLASLNDSSSAIYSAGQGAPELPALMKRLSDHKGQIYLSRGNNQEVPRLLNTLRDVDAQLRAVEDNAGRYGVLTVRKSEIDVELQDADAKLELVSVQRTEIQNLIKGWDDWVALSDCETQLRDMPLYMDFPENPVTRLDSLEERVRLFREERDEAASQLQRAVEAAAADIPGEALLEDAVSIEAVRRARSSYDNSVHDLPERQAELKAMESELSDRLRDLGQDWNEDRLQSFDASIAFRQEVEQGKERLAQGQDAVRRAEQMLEQEKRTLADCEAAVVESRERMPTNPPSLDDAELERRRAALRAARGRLNEYERVRQNHENLRVQLNSLTAGQGPSVRPSWLRPGLRVGFILLPLIIGVFVLLGIAVYLLVSRRSARTDNPLVISLKQQTADAEESAKSAWQHLIEAALPLEIDEDPTAAVLDSTESRLDSAHVALSIWDGARERVEEALRRLRSQEQRMETATVGLQSASDYHGEARREWQDWLEQCGLPTSFTPDTVTEFMGQMETNRARQEQVRDNRRRVAAIEYDIQEFREQVEPLTGRHNLTLDPEDQRQLARVADELIRRLDEAQTAVSQREQVRMQEEEIRELLESRERRLQSSGEELAALLKAANADDPEDFRRRAQQYADRLELERQRDDHRRSLERLSGPGERFDAFREALATADPNRLLDESARLSELHAEVDAKRNALREERGGIDTELTQLTSEEESSALRIRRSTLEEQLRGHAREWSRLTIAETLLEKTRQKFEQERQPSVIRHAQDFFSGVTGQRYNRLYAPIGEQTITVTHAGGSSKRPDELSRGTREQLYLALRFGLIREFGEHAERLPVVVDEALVNFDPERARLAAESFAQLAETNQVLVFTCHPATAEMFADVAGAQVVDISRTYSEAALPD